MRGEFDEGGRYLDPPRLLGLLAVLAWLGVFSVLLAGQDRRESATVPAATFQWTGDPNRDRASVRQECATHDGGVPVAECEAAYEGLACVFTELERAIGRRGQALMLRYRDPGIRSERLGIAWTAAEFEAAIRTTDAGPALDANPFVDFEDDVAGVFVNGEFLTCTEDDQ